MGDDDFENDWLLLIEMAFDIVKDIESVGELLIVPVVLGDGVGELDVEIDVVGSMDEDSEDEWLSVGTKDIESVGERECVSV